MKRVWLLAFLLAGCTTDPVEEPGADDIIGRPDTSYGIVETGPAVGPDLNATTAEAPRLIEGEWWRIQYESFAVDELVEVVRVVANATDEGYIMGMPHEGWLKEAISFHSPSFGNVNLDLSYNTHNERFAPVVFPLEEGATWETTFAATPFTAVVESADQYTATIRFDPAESDDPMNPLFDIAGLSSTPMTLVYDARQHEIVSMESPLGTWTVIEHGYDYEGWVTVPHGEDTAIDYGTFGPASEQHDVRERTLDVEGDFNRMTMMHFVGSLGDAPAYVSLKHITPDGETWQTEMTGAGFEIAFFETNQPNGRWTVQDTAGGAAFTYSMGIAYLQYDILLPEQTRRSDHGHGVIR